MVDRVIQSANFAKLVNYLKKSKKSNSKNVPY